MSDDARAPWEADEELDAERVAALLPLLAPDLAGQAVTALGEGWDYRAFAVGGEVLRIAKRAEDRDAVAREVALLDWIAPLLPIAVPRPRLVGPVAGAPGGLMRYPILPGRTLDEAAASDGDLCRVAADLGGVLAELHALPPSRARALGVSDDGWSDPARHARKALARLRDVEDHVPRDVIRATRRFLESKAPPPGAGERVLTHADIWPEHLLVSGSCELVGLIDWADAEIGDPAADFAGAWHLAGDAGLDAALGAGAAPALRDRARLLGVVHAVGDAWYALRRSLPRYLEGSTRALSRL